MSLPVPANVTFAIYRGVALPPAAAAATDVAGHLEGAYDDGQAATDAPGEFRYTHVLLVEGAVDVRDDFQSFVRTGFRDVIFVPDDGGTPFDVVFVERPPAAGFLRVFLNRRAPAWPTNEL